VSVLGLRWSWGVVLVWSLLALIVALPPGPPAAFATDVGVALFVPYLVVRGVVEAVGAVRRRLSGETSETKQRKQNETQSQT